MLICALGSERGDAGPAQECEGSGGPQLEARPRNTGRNTTFKQSVKIISAFDFFFVFTKTEQQILKPRLYQRLEYFQARNTSS